MNNAKQDQALIAALGGPSKVAEQLGFTVQRVQNWLSRGIPARVKLDRPDLFSKVIPKKRVYKV